MTMKLEFVARRVKVEKLIVNEWVLPRKLDESLADQYAEDARNGAKFPPMEIVEVEDVGLVIADGLHRRRTYEIIGQVSVDALVAAGTLTDAFLHAATANLKHGRRLKMGDMSKVIERFLSDRSPFYDELGKWSHVKIAAHLRCSDTYVGSVKKKMGVTDDGSRTVTRNGSEYDMDTSASMSSNDVADADVEEPDFDEPEPSQSSKVVDAKGKAVPENLVPVFSQRWGFNNLQDQCTSLAESVRLIAKSDGGGRMDAAKVLKMIGDVRAHLGRRMPHATCAVCKGFERKDADDCVKCNGSGWCCKDDLAKQPKEF